MSLRNRLSLQRHRRARAYEYVVGDFAITRVDDDAFTDRTHLQRKRDGSIFVRGRLGRWLSVSIWRRAKHAGHYEVGSSTGLIGSPLASMLACVSLPTTCLFTLSRNSSSFICVMPPKKRSSSY